MFLSGLKYLRRLERQVKFAKNRCCKIKPVAVMICFSDQTQQKDRVDSHCGVVLHIKEEIHDKRRNDLLLDIGGIVSICNKLANKHIKCILVDSDCSTDQVVLLIQTRRTGMFQIYRLEKNRIFLFSVLFIPVRQPIHSQTVVFFNRYVTRQQQYIGEYDERLTNDKKRRNC